MKSVDYLTINNYKASRNRGLYEFKETLNDKDLIPMMLLILKIISVFIFNTNSYITNSIINLSKWEINSIVNNKNSIDINVSGVDNYDKYVLNMKSDSDYKSIPITDINNIRVSNLKYNDEYNIHLYGIRNNNYIELINDKYEILKGKENIRDAVIDDDLIVTLNGNILTENVDYTISIGEEHLVNSVNVDRYTKDNTFSKRIFIKGINDFDGRKAKTISYHVKENRLEFLKQDCFYSCFPTNLTMLLHGQFDINSTIKDISSIVPINYNYTGLCYDQMNYMMNYLASIYNLKPNIKYYYDLSTYNDGTLIYDDAQYTSIYNYYNNIRTQYHINGDYSNNTLMCRNEITSNIVNELNNLLKSGHLVIVRGNTPNNPIKAAHTIICYDYSDGWYKICDPISGATSSWNEAYLRNYMSYHTGLFWFN